MENEYDEAEQDPIPNRASPASGIGWIVSAFLEYSGSR